MHTPDQTTNVRTLRTFLERTMSEAEKSLATPTICTRIRELREERKERWAADHPKERGNPFTQENVAPKVGVTRDQYRKYETTQEPSMKRQRQIALALGLQKDYFEATGSLAQATANLEAETERLKALGDDLEGIVPALRELLRSRDQGEETSQAPGERD